MFFDEDQARVSFKPFATWLGTMTVDFFRRDGSLIQTMVITNLEPRPNWGYGFRRVGGIGDIAGFSIQNDDDGGVAYDNFCYTGGVGGSNGLSCCPKTQGFWKRQCQGPHPSGEDANLPSYVDCVRATEPFRGVADETGICDHLSPEPPSDKCEQAQAQAMALRLNVCSGRLEVGCSGGNVGESVQAISDLLSAPDVGKCRDAQALAAGINEAESACTQASDDTDGSSDGDAEDDEDGGSPIGKDAGALGGLSGGGHPGAATEEARDGGPGEDRRDPGTRSAGVGGSGAACNIAGNHASLVEALVLLALGLPLSARGRRRPLGRAKHEE